MTRFRTLLVAAPVALGMLSAPAAHAEWRGDGWGHRGGGLSYRGGWRHGGPGFGLPLAAAIVGAAVVGGLIATHPPVVYAPQPVYGPPPGYYPPPAYAAPAYPGPYYPGPGYGQQ